MSDTVRDGRTTPVAAQVAAGILSAQRIAREDARDVKLSETIDACKRAKEQYEIVRDYVFNPDTTGPRGSPLTQHGEIAEKLNVAVINAKEILEGRRAIAKRLEGKEAADLIIDDELFQSKYGKVTYRSLREIVRHLEEKGPDNPTLFVMPPEQRAHLDQLRDSDSIDGLTQREIAAIREQLDSIKRLAKRDPQEIISAGETTWEEVQPARVGETIKEREREVEVRSNQRKEQIFADHAPSVEELVQATGLAGVAGAGVGITQAILVKLRQGKNPFKGEFTGEDWAQIGVSGGKGSGAGVVGGSTLYLLTNATNLAAPFAGSLVSTMMGINSLHRSYRAGDIDNDQFVDYCQVVASEAAIIGLAAAAGQAMIPIPILGAFVGSVAGKIVATALKGRLERDASELAASFVDYERWAMAQLDDSCRELMSRIDEHFMELDELEKLAFDPDTNTDLRLRVSAKLARRVSVPDDLVVDSTDELDAFMTE